MDKSLLNWSRKNYSDLPWRQNRNLYTTLVSEIMLQQTTVGTVLNHFDKFIEKYPSVNELAKINEDQILKDWKGLGYYRRAKNLLTAAKEISKDFNGVIPLDREKLLSIKGIGEYTADALISIGANKSALALDANLERVIARFYKIEIEKGPKLHKAIRASFEAAKICQEIHTLGARDFNEALMDLGRSVCQARKAYCELCPINSSCASRGLDPLTLPIQNKAKSNEQFDLHLLRVIVKKNDQILAYKKSDKEWLSGQFEIPTFVLFSEDESLVQYPAIAGDSFYNLDSFSTAITKYKITNYVLVADLSDLSLSENYEFYPLDDLNLSTASFKALNL